MATFSVWFAGKHHHPFSCLFSSFLGPNLCVAAHRFYSMDKKKKKLISLFLFFFMNLSSSSTLVSSSICPSRSATDYILGFRDPPNCPVSGDESASPRRRFVSVTEVISFHLSNL